ncbi:AzlD domain-containing protein [Corynebacterium uropygiale]|uniref:AzlD domain-containing protein n=1 Tax=Corynebacterium uropygiale TaxID=1775911 RepID=A0A9X1QTP3_9CORY|nr:AzlD domain-containing protein [Corynebacterium uropygiale]MCF4007643.1 AzlD domain-containing protein [Corynebacterium uropygiale]
MSHYGLPESVSLSDVWLVLIPVGIVTVLIRQAPFSFLSLLKGSPLVEFFGAMMPVGVMVILVMYTLHGQLDAPGGLLASGIAVAITLLLHWWRRDSGLSIVGGTASYMLLVNWVF